MSDDRTPILIGAGQAIEPVPPDLHRASTAYELAAEAARRALEDAAGKRPLGPQIDTIVGIRTFPDSSRLWANPFGGSNNLPRSVARRIDADPARAVYAPVGGNTPQAMVNEFAEALWHGEAEVVLICGAEAIASTRAATRAAVSLDWHEDIEGDLEDRGPQIDGLLTDVEVQHKLFGTPPAYALFEIARRARLGLDADQYSRAMGELLAPLSEIAAGNPYAMFAEALTPRQITEATAGNRMIATPYTKAMVARDAVNQGAAVLMTTVGKAHELEIPEGRWIYLHGYAEAAEKPILERPDLGESPAMTAAYRQAMDGAGVTLENIRYFDIYSCFPIAVFAVCDALGLAPDDPRGLTLTGGLPFFGGPGNNYSLHAIAEVVMRLRRDRNSLAIVGANGGFLSKHAVGVYAGKAPPGGWQPQSSRKLQADLDAGPGVVVETAPEGAGVIESYTVTWVKGEPALAIVIGQLAETGARFIANNVEGDRATLHILLQGAMEGRGIFVTTTQSGNRFAFDASRLQGDPSPA